MDELVDALTQRRHVVGILISHSVSLTEVTGRGDVLCHHQALAGGTLLQTLELAEDGTSAIVEQEDAQTAVDIAVPEGVLVVEETEIAQDAEYLLLFLGIWMMIFREMDG